MKGRFLLSFAIMSPIAAWAEEVGQASGEGIGQLSQPVGTGEVLQVFLALVFVLLLIGVGAWLLRRFSVAGFAHKGPLQLLASVSVGQRERIVLIQAGETQMLIGVGQGSIRTLHVFDKPIMLGGKEPPGGERFAERLAAFMNRDGGESK